MAKFKEILNQKFAIIASLPKNDYDLAKAAWEAGADAVKIHINVEHRASGTHFMSFEEELKNIEKILKDSPVPVGIVAGADLGSVRNDLNNILNNNFDFISLYLNHTPTEVFATNVTKMMACDYTYSMEEISLFKDLGTDILEASIMKPDTYGQELSMAEVLKYKQLVEVSKLPVIVPTQRKISINDAKTIKSTGVSGIMLGTIVMGNTVESISETIKLFAKELN